MTVLLKPSTWIDAALAPLRWLWLYRPKRHNAKKPFIVWRILLWTWRTLLILLVLDALYIWSIWPDWTEYARGPIPKSKFIEDYELQSNKNKKQPRLRWQRIALSSLPDHVKRAAIAGEDSRFYSHSGVDTIAIREAIDKNITMKKWKYGASTISQQTVKNLFFSSERTFLRKWHELFLTLGMERHLSKDRIMELYLNIAEFGEGIYGIESAAQHYYLISAKDLNERQSAELIATLPSPRKHNPSSRTSTFSRRANGIYRWMHNDKEIDKDNWEDEELGQLSYRPRPG